MLCNTVCYMDSVGLSLKLLFERMFNVLDECVKNGDLQSLATTLESVVDLAKSSPFKELASVESVRALLEDPNRNIDF